MKIVKWPWPLTFILPWPWVWPLTIWRFFFFIFFHFLWSHGTQKRDVVRQTDGRLQNRRSIRNILQPTRSLYHFRFKTYGPLCDFYKSGDLDLDLYPIFTKKFCQGPWNWVHQLSKFQKDWASGVACTSCNYGQTDKQTDRQTDRHTAVTNILCKNLQFCKVINRGDNRVF